MNEYGPRPHIPLSEFEVFIGNILGKTGALTTHQRELSFSMKERFDDKLAFTIGRMRGDHYQSGSNDNEDFDTTASKVALALSSACLFITLGSALGVKYEKKKTSKLKSFGYVAAAVCLMEMERISGPNAFSFHTLGEALPRY